MQVGVCSVDLGMVHQRIDVNVCRKSTGRVTVNL